MRTQHGTRTRALIAPIFLATSALTTIGAAAPARPARGEAPAGEPPITFARDVRPILAENCVLCHGPDGGARQARLRLDRPDAEPGSRVAGWLTERGGLAAVVPGRPEESELLARVTDEDDEWRMPPAEHAERLPAEQVETLRRWIAAGAPYDEHWAYASLASPPVPEVPGGSGVHPIDAFVIAKLSSEGLELQPEAGRRALLRRVSFDLTGLPPTVEQLAAFLADDAEGAYERAVDRLLDSDAYAEHWTRAWLDLARYADSQGYSIDGRRSIWPWRDWVLRAIRDDLPYDEFSVRQLAGDLLPDATRADHIATGFQRNTQINQEGGAKDEENRVNAVHDRVATTGTVWLGSTLTCAQCHDHKFDPISQRDYYRMFAFYDTTVDGGVTDGPALLVADTPDEQRIASAYESDVARAQAEFAAAASAAAAGWATWLPSETRTDNGPELVLRADGSWLAVGQSPVTTVYELTGRVPDAGLAALRLEVLPDRALPAHGPGRAGNGNFVLTELRVETRPGPRADWQRVELEQTVADFEQDTSAEGGGVYPAADVLVAEGGWAIKPTFGQPHALHALLVEPLAAREPGSEASHAGRELRVVLAQRHGSSHTIGCFRLLTSARGLPAPVVSRRWLDASAELALLDRNLPPLPSSLVMRERWEPRRTHVFGRGSFLDPHEPVEPGTPLALAHLVEERAPDARLEGAAAGDQRPTRLDLARWLVHPDNALAHRVTVNRWWQAFFGRGLVATENDFGLRGAGPTHPALLEWLARDFVASGFSRRHVHRRIVTSRTYRQRAPAWGALDERDPENSLLARQRRLRLDPEAIRDAALVASDLLAPRFGGPPVQPPQPDGIFAFIQQAKEWDAAQGPDRYRRTLYTRRWRSAVYPFLTTFDAPAPNVSCTRREPTTSPLQALTLANDPMLLELAAGLAARVSNELGVTGRLQAEAAEPEAAVQGVALAFELALGRAPQPAELAVLVAHREQIHARRLAAGDDPTQADNHARTAVCRVLFNLDEFVHRP